VTGIEPALSAWEVNLIRVFLHVGDFTAGTHHMIVTQP
jgi:hypothetical protein